MKKSFMRRSFALFLAIIFIAAFVMPDFLYAEDQPRIPDKAASIAADYMNINKIEHGLFPVRQENIAPDNIKPAALNGVTYKLKDSVEVIPSDVTLKSDDGKTKVYSNTTGFKFIKGKTYVDKNTKAAFIVQDISNLTRVDTCILSNNVQLNELIEDFEIPEQDLVLSSANIDPSTVNPYVTINHGAKPDQKILEKMNKNIYNLNPKIPPESPVDINSNINTGQINSTETVPANTNTRIGTIDINKVILPQLPEADVPQTSVMSGTLPGGLDGNGMAVDKGSGYIEINFNDMDLSKFIDKTKLSSKNGSIVVKGLLNGKVGFYQPTIHPYYKFGKKLGAEFRTGQVIDLQMTGDMQFTGGYRIPIYGFDVAVSDVGNISAGIFLRMTFDGEVHLELDLDQDFSYKVGAEVGFKWLVVPTGLKTYSDFKRDFDADYTLNMQASIYVCVGAEVELKLFGFDLLNIHAYIGSVADVTLILSNDNSISNLLDIDINGYADVGGAIVGIGFSIYNGKWFKKEKIKPYTGRFEMPVLDTDAYRNIVKGRMTYKPSGQIEYGAYTGDLDVVVFDINNKETPYHVKCDSKGNFTIKNVTMYKGDKVNVRVTDPENNENIKFNAVPCRIHFKDIVIKRADFFNDVVEGYIPSYFDGNEEIKYNGPIDLQIKHGETSYCIPIVQVESDLVNNAPNLTDGRELGILPAFSAVKLKDSVKNGEFKINRSIVPTDEAYAKININGFELYGNKTASSYRPLEIRANYTLKVDLIHKGINDDIEKYVITAEIKGIVENVGGSKTYKGNVHLQSGDFLNSNGFEFINDDIKVKPISGTSYSSFEISRAKEYPNNDDNFVPPITVEDATYLYDKITFIENALASASFDVEGKKVVDSYWFFGNPFEKAAKDKLEFEKNSFAPIEETDTFDIADPLMHPETAGDFESKLLWGLQNIAAGKSVNMTSENSTTVKSLKLRKNANNLNYSVDVVVKSGGNTVTNMLQVKGNLIKSVSTTAGGKITFQNDLTQGYMTLSNTVGNTNVRVDKTEQSVLTPVKVTVMKDTTIDRKLCSVYMYEFENSKVQVSMWKEKGLPISVRGYDSSGNLRYEVSYNNYKF